MQQRLLGRTAIPVSVLGFGTFKIGRNSGHHFPEDYELPSDADAERLLCSLLDEGITYFDTAPSYGLSEERIGRALGHRRDKFVLSTKVGESHAHDVSQFDFRATSIRQSVHASLQKLCCDHMDVLFVHSDGNDLEIQQSADVVATLQDLRTSGATRAIGFSGKTLAGTRAALDWADVVMVTHHLEDQSAAPVLVEAHRRGVGVVVKKGLASGRIDPSQGLPFVLSQDFVSTVLIGSCNLAHMRQAIAIADEVLGADA